MNEWQSNKEKALFFKLTKAIISTDCRNWFCDLVWPAQTTSAAEGKLMSVELYWTPTSLADRASGKQALPNRGLMFTRF